MKSFMKVSAITAAILIVLGLALAIPAIAIKGRAEVSHIADEVTNGKLHINFGGMENWGIYFGDSGSGIAFKDGEKIISGDHEETCSADGIAALQIELGGCSMDVKASEDNDFHVNISGVGKFQAYADGDTLCIKGVKNGKLIGGGSLGKVVLYVPQGMTFTEVGIALGAGEVSVGTALDAQEIKLNVGAGQIACNGGLRADRVEAAVGAGEILFQDVAAGELQASVGMGDLEFSGSIEKKAKLDCSMGDITMKLAGSEKDYNYTVTASMGEVTVGGSTMSGMSSEKSLNNNAPCDIRLDCSMGSIVVSFVE